MKAVRATIENDEKLKKLGSIEGMIKKMVDYLQNLQKNKPRKDPKELSVIQKKDMVEQWLKSTDCQASSSTCSTVKLKWSDEDVDKIKKTDQTLITLSFLIDRYSNFYRICIYFVYLINKI